MKSPQKSFAVELGIVGRVRCEPGWHLGPDWARGLHDYDLWFVWAGRGQMTAGKTECALVPGTCVWMRPGNHYVAEQDLAAPLGVNFIHFTLKRGDRALPLSAFEPPFEVMRTRHLELVDTLMRRVIELRAEPAGLGVAEALTGALLMDLTLEAAATTRMSAPGLDQHHRDVILQAAAEIRESPGRVPTIAALARKAGYSVDHFSRVFLKVTRQRPQDYVINAKIDRARQLLSESNLTIGMIAEALGFRDIFFFSRQFRQKTGETPTEFRRGLRRI
ncbi:MAG: putative AraC family transcriptional regulator [Verrucomicrobia bacterium]|nr:putative AraC family transcriptional regulator [Verrucomicrobiota bacterium]